MHRVADMPRMHRVVNMPRMVRVGSMPKSQLGARAPWRANAFQSRHSHGTSRYATVAFYHSQKP
jgi:hypothetical protein